MSNFIEVGLSQEARSSCDPVQGGAQGLSDAGSLPSSGHVPFPMLTPKQPHFLPPRALNTPSPQSHLRRGPRLKGASLGPAKLRTFFRDSF